MGRATDSRLSPPSRRAAWWSVLRFGGFVFLISGILSLVALPWVTLPWWKVFRRCVSVASVISLWQGFWYGVEILGTLVKYLCHRHGAIRFAQFR
mgnify:CR=1 FL=1